MALGIMEELEKSGKIPKFTEAQHNSAEYLHAVIETVVHDIRCAFGCEQLRPLCEVRGVEQALRRHAFHLRSDGRRGQRHFFHQQ
jgi:hypothetical protein